MSSRSSSSRTYQNQNFLGADGFVHNIYIGNQNAFTVEQTETELTALAKQLRNKQRPVLILVDISQIDKIHLSARHAGYQLMRNLDYDKAAICGNHIRFKGVAEAVILATGCGFKVKLFDSLALARQWLLKDV